MKRKNKRITKPNPAVSKKRSDVIGDQIDLLKENAGFDYDSSMDKPGGLRTLRNKLIPTGLNAQIKKAVSYSENNDFVQPLIETLQDFGAAGFHNMSINPKAEKYYNNICKEHNMDGVVLRMWNDVLSTSNIVFHYKLDTAEKVEYIMTLDPRRVEVVPMFGDKLVFVEPDDAMKDLVRARTDEEKKRLKDIPKKWIAACKGSGDIPGHKGQVLLLEKDKEYAIVRNAGGREDRMTKPTMCSIFDALHLRDLLIDGDYSVAYLIKNCITMVKSGEPILAGPKTGSRVNWAKPKDLDALKVQFRTPSKAIRIYGNHTLTIDFIFPDVALFAPTKYQAVEKRILMWAGLSLGLMIGEGGNYATLYVNIKKVVAKVKKYRRMIGRLIERFYQDIKPDFISKEDVPQVKWDEDLLKEPRQLLQEITMLVKQGLLSGETTLDTFDQEYDIELERKKNADKNKKYFVPIYEPGQGMSLLRWGAEPGAKIKKPGEGEPGKPEGNQPTPPNKGPGPNQPRPSTADDFLDLSLIETASVLEGTDLEPDFAPFKTMPAGSPAFKMWERIYRGALKRGASVKSAARQAWSVVKKYFKKNKEGKWVRKEKADTFTIAELAVICPSCATMFSSIGMDEIELGEDWFMDDAAKYEPPQSGDAPKEVKSILNEVYNDCRKLHPGESKEWKTRCSKIAWFAVKNAGWVKDKKTGEWEKKK